jgi:hypothetical protein
VGRLLPIAIACLALAAPGCGGDAADDSAQPSNVTTGAVTRDEFIAQADAACKKFDARVKELAGKSPTDVAATYRATAKEARTFYGEFAAIPKPPADERVLSSYQRVLNDSIKVTEEGADAIEGSDQKRFRELTTEAGKLSRENTRIAQRYGFKVCGGTVAK